MQNGVVLVGDEYEKKVVEVANCLRLASRSVQASALMSKERSYLTTKQQTLSSLNMQDPVLQLLYRVIIDHCVKAEKAGPGAFLPTLEAIVESILTPLPIENVKLEVTNEGSFRPTWNETKKLVNETFGDEFLSNLFFQALSLSGIEGRIFVEKAAGDVTSVEKLNGFSFNCEFPTKFTGTRHNVRVFVVDGFLETVAELNSLFQKASETKETVLIACRGVSDDVVNTITVNEKRGTLNIIPVFVRYDFDGLNVLNDIAIVSGTDVMSSMKGQLISSVNLLELPIVPSVSCKDGVMTIVNDKAVRRAALQVSQLMEKRLEATLDQFRTIFDDRVKSLTPSSVRIRLPGDRNVSAYTEKLDAALRLIRSAIKRGFFSGSRMRTKNSLLERFADPVPYETVLATLTFTESCLKALQGVNCVIA